MAKNVDKRRITTVMVSIVLDGEISKELFEEAFIPPIRRVCIRDSMKYAPVAWLNNIETKEMEVIGK